MKREKPLSASVMAWHLWHGVSCYSCQVTVDTDRGFSYSITFLSCEIPDKYTEKDTILYYMSLQYILRYIYAVDVIKRWLNLAWWNNGPHVLFLLWLYTCTSRSCSLYSWWTAKSILGVSVAVTSGSHLFVKDLAPFKLLFPFSMPILCTKLSCHWWHQMTSIIVYSLRSKDGLQYMLLKHHESMKTLGADLYKHIYTSQPDQAKKKEKVQLLFAVSYQK